MNDRCSFIFITLLLHTTTLTISTKNFLQLISPSLFHPYLFIKSFLQFPLTLSSSKPQHFFHLPFFVYSDPYNQSLSQPFGQFSLCKETNEQRSLVRTDTDLISLFFLKVQTRITATDSILLKLRKFVYCRKFVFDEYA